MATKWPKKLEDYSQEQFIQKIQNLREQVTTLERARRQDQEEYFRLANQLHAIRKVVKLETAPDPVHEAVRSWPPCNCMLAKQVGDLVVRDDVAPELNPCPECGACHWCAHREPNGDDLIEVNDFG